MDLETNSHLAHCVARTQRLDHARASFTQNFGTIDSMTRGALSQEISIPADEYSPLGGSPLTLIGLGTKGLGVQHATRGGMPSFVRALPNELVPLNIRVSTVTRGPTATVMAASMEIRETLTTLTQIGRIARAVVVTGAVLFHLIDQSSFITGVELSADGGMKADA